MHTHRVHTQRTHSNTKYAHKVQKKQTMYTHFKDNGGHTATIKTTESPSEDGQSIDEKIKNNKKGGQRDHKNFNKTE